MSSADNLCNQLDPDNARQSIEPAMDPNCLTLLKNFSKKLILKKSADDQKNLQNYPEAKSY